MRSVTVVNTGTDRDVRFTTLDNGLRVVTEPITDARSIAIGCWAGVGNRDEPPATAGVSHFLEHLLFKGTQRRSARDIAEAVDATGGEMNAYTTKEYTAYYLRLPARHTAFAVDLLCDVVTAPAFRPDEVDSERQVILEELHLQNDEPDDLVHTELYDALFPEHPLGWEILGTESTIDAMTPEAIRAFHAEWYRPQSLIFAAAGPLDHDALCAEVSAAFTDAPSGRRPSRAAPARDAQPLRVLRRAGESVHVALGWRALSHEDPDRFALAVANQIIGGGLSSRLFQEVRETRGLAYSVFSSTSSYADTGVLSIYAGTMPSRVRELLEVIDDQLASIVADGVSDHELAVAKGAFEGSTIISLEDTGNRMARLATSLAVRNAVMPVDEYLANIDAVTVDDVRRVIDRVLGSPRTIAAVGPVLEDDLVQ
jgi:predicted Zn-dependent peptidase